MAHHDLKLSAEFFDASEAGLKPFEVRVDDRLYLVGDTIRLHEVRRESGYISCTGRVGRLWRVTFTLVHHECAGVADGWVVLGLAPVAE